MRGAAASNANKFDNICIGIVAEQYYCCSNQIAILMNTKKIQKDIDTLIKGINEVISKDRYLFLDSDKILLEECKKALEEAKQKGNKKTNFIFYSALAVKVAEIFAKIFFNS